MTILFIESKGTLKSLIFLVSLKTYAANLHTQISCVGKEGKSSGSCLSTIYDFGSIQFSGWIFPHFLNK